MNKLLRTENNGMYDTYYYACCECGKEVSRFQRMTKRNVICKECTKKREREKAIARNDAKIKEAYDKGYADAIERFRLLTDGELFHIKDNQFVKKASMLVDDVYERMKEERGINERL